MKNLILFLLVFSSASVFAGTTKIQSLAEEAAKSDISRVVQTITLGSNAEKNITVNLVTVDNGLSTDLSLRYTIYLTFFHAGEMNNTRTAFELTQAIKLPTAKRLSAGVYEVRAQSINLENSQILNKILNVNTAQIFIDDRNLKLEEFEDAYFSSTVSVTQK